MPRKFFYLTCFLFSISGEIEAQVSADSAYTVPTTGAQHVQSGDVNGDGYTDIGFACGNDISGGINTSLIFLNNGEGTIDTINPIKLYIKDAYAMDFGDIDNNGTLDVIFAGYNNDNSCNSKLFFNGGLGNFTDSVCFPNSKSGDVKIVDLDNDGWKDIVFATYYSGTDNQHSIVYWNNAGTFSPSSFFKFPVENAKQILYADVDKDNDTDLLFISFDSDTTASFTSYSRLFYNIGGRNFDTTVAVKNFSGKGAWSGVFTDLNGDAWDDIIIGNSYDGSTGAINSDVYYNDGLGGFPPSPDLSFPCFYLWYMRAADMNDDGYEDIITANSNGSDANKNYIFYYNSTGLSVDFANPDSFPHHWLTSVTSGDVDKDFDNDLIYARLYNTGFYTDYSTTQSPVFLNQKYSPPEFTFDVTTVFKSNAKKSVRIGWDANATSGVDTIFAEKNISPLFQDANLVMENNSDISKVDVRQKRFDKYIWKIQIDSTVGNTFPITFKWNKSKLAGKGNFYLQSDPNNYSFRISMHATDSFQLVSSLKNIYIVYTKKGLADMDADISIWTNNGKNDLLQFGRDTLGTDGIDTILGEIDLPPPPPGNNFDARFILPDQVHSSKRDIRDSSLTAKSWLLRWQCLNSEFPVTVKWDSLSLTPVGNFRWIIKDNVTGMIYKVRMDSVDSLVVTNTGLRELVITFDSTTTGISEMKFLPEVRFYPNPFNDNVMLYMNNIHARNLEIDIYDMLGRKFFTETFSLNSSQTKNLPLASLPPGIYFAKIKIGKYQSVKKLVKF